MILTQHLYSATNRGQARTAYFIVTISRIFTQDKTNRADSLYKPARTKNQNSRLPLNTSVMRQITPLTCSRSSVRWAWWMSMWR